VLTALAAQVLVLPHMGVDSAGGRTGVRPAEFAAEQL